MIHSACKEWGQTALSRRCLLKLGGLGLLGWRLPGLADAAERSAGLKARAKSVIFLHQYGGPSHHDTFDMKPSAPAAIRGEFQPISTRVPGIQVCDRLPNIAKVADKFALVRSLTHEMKNHNSAGYYSLTGHAPATDDQRLRDIARPVPGLRFRRGPAGSRPARYSHVRVVSLCDPRRLHHAGPARQFSRQGPRSPVRGTRSQQCGVLPARVKPPGHHLAGPAGKPPGDFAAGGSSDPAARVFREGPRHRRQLWQGDEHVDGARRQEGLRPVG